MHGQSLIKPIYKSIYRATTDLIDEMNATGNFPPIQFHNFESRFDENKLPEVTLFGIDGLSFVENNGLWVIRFAAALSSFKDTNLMHEVDMLDYVQQRWGEGQKIALREMTAGNEVSEMVVVAFEVLPMGQSELRNYRTIGMELNRTGA